MKSRLGIATKKMVSRLLSRLGSFVPRDVETRISRVEEDLFDRFRTPSDEIRVLFILAAPRTGSTMLYQMMARYLRLHFFSNYVTNNFPTHPLVGTVIERAIAGILADGISLHSRYGETAGPHEPNEATRVFDQWFPHEHPSETRSAKIRKGRRTHMINTISGINAFTGSTIVVKNAWNCFRVEELVSTFPAARFVWLRRDIASSSFSALKARQRQGDPATVWNSASPANYEEIRQLPCTEQVVEQQFRTNKAVEKSLLQFVPAENAVEVWYEDIVAEPLAALKRIAALIPQPRARDIPETWDAQNIDLRPAHAATDSEEFVKIRRYAMTKYPELLRQ